MKKILIVIITVIFIISALNVPVATAAEGEPSPTSSSIFTLRVKPVDGKIVALPFPVIPGEEALVLYEITNYTKYDWYCKVNIQVPQSVWVGAKWVENDQTYIPGQGFPIRAGSKRNMEISFSMDINGDQYAFPITIDLYPVMNQTLGAPFRW